MVLRLGFLAAEVAGAVMLGLALSASPPGAAPAVYTTSSSCAGCAVSLKSVQVEPRANGLLFVVRGTFPGSVAKLASSVRLQADGLDAVLEPKGGRIELAGATLYGQPVVPHTVAAGIEHGVFLLFVHNGVLTTPVQFAVGTWNGSRYTSRLPTTGSLLWSGGRTLAHDPSGSITTAGTTAPEELVTGMADSCVAIPSGTVPAVLKIGAVSSGNRTDPRRHLPVNWAGLTYATPLAAGFGGQAPFSAAVFVDQPDRALPKTGLAIDRLGQLQFWAIWNGTQLYKAVREWNGRSWTTLVDDAADPMTLDMSEKGVTFYWPGLRPGDRVGALIAVDGGCAADGLAAGRASVVASGLQP